MNKAEALNFLEAKLDDYRGRSYAKLRSLIGHDQQLEAVGPSGIEYQVEIQIRWDHKPDGSIRVSGAIDDGGLRAIVPLCRDLLISPDGRTC